MNVSMGSSGIGYNYFESASSRIKHLLHFIKRLFHIIISISKFCVRQISDLEKLIQDQT